MYNPSHAKVSQGTQQMTNNLQRSLVKCWSASASGEQLTTSLWCQFVTICLLWKSKIKLQKSASDYCCCIWIGLHKVPEWPAQNCTTPEGHKGVFPSQEVPILWESQCLLQSPLYCPVTTGGLTVLILSNWHEQRRSVEFYSSE